MSEGTFFMYMEAVLIFTLLPIHGQDVICDDQAFTLVEGVCYRRDFDLRTWEEAKDNCEKWNGQLATFTSFEHLARVFKNMKMPGDYQWISHPNEPQQTISQWAAYHDNNEDVYSANIKGCVETHTSLCMEKTTATKTTQNVNTITNEQSNLTKTIDKGTCLPGGYFFVDGQCYRLSTEELTSSQANNLCYEGNETLATISSIEQGIKVLQSLNAERITVFVDFKFGNHKGNVIDLYKYGGCYTFVYKILRDDDWTYKGVCTPLPLTTTQASTTTLESTTTQKPTTTRELTTEPLIINGPESTSTTKSTTTFDLTNTHESSTTPLSQNQIVNRNRLLHVNRLMAKVSVETIIDFDTRNDYYALELD